MRRLAATLVATLVVIDPGPTAAAGDPADAGPDPMQRAVRFLLASQNDDGSWGNGSNATFTSVWSNPQTHRSWKIGTTALCCMALMRTAESPTELAALDEGLAYIAANDALQRPSSWDIDNVWGAVYGLQALALALQDERAVSAGRRAAIRGPAEAYLQRLMQYQSPNGGWGYYAFGRSAYRPEWATSFTSAVAILAMLDAREAGLPVDASRLAAAVRAVERCRLPSGAYTYSVSPIPSPGSLEGIDQVKGSLGRIQICNLALHRAGGAIDEADLEHGIEQFFDHRRFLEVARHKPIPHEAYYANAGYFFYFGHFYAAEVIALLPQPARRAYAERLVAAIEQTQNDDGSMSDFVLHSYPRRYGTAFGVLALAQCREKPE